MFRFGIGVATILVTFSMIAPAIDGAAAEPRDKKEKGSPAGRQAAPPRSSGPPPAVARPAAQAAPAFRHAPPPQRSAAPRAAPAFRHAPQRSAAPSSAPRMTAPPRLSVPRTVAPAQQRAPQIQRAQPRPQFQPRQQAVQPSQPRVSPQIRDAGRIQQPRQDVQQRIQQLQQQPGRARLSRDERRELRQLRREDRQQRSVEINRRRLEQLQQRATQGQLNRNQSRELRRLERADQSGRLGPRLQVREPSPQRARPARVTPQQVAQGRFASKFHSGKLERRAEHRASRLSARAAWRHKQFAHHVPWLGPIYWPYAYHDIFYYTFWPDAYDNGYWAYAYDFFFDSIFFPDGAPYVDYANLYRGPYGPATTGSVPTRTTPSVPGRVAQATREFCADQAKGIVAWPFEQIEAAIQPTSEQRNLIESLKAAAAKANAQFKEACPDTVPLTPPGRLQAMTMRLQATLDAVKTVRPALEAFYQSLSDEQKARFNELGPDFVKQRQGAAVQAAQGAQAECGGAKAALSGLAIDRIEDLVRPTDAQSAALDRLDDAIQKALDRLQAACPTAAALTPVGRLEAMQQRLEAMIAAANAVRPALDDFYAALDDEQKARFNRLDRETAPAGG
jgi:LTXXQ motif family protein